MSMPISGFTAIPNPQMLAFMGAQSFIMMYQAGEGWQYGKRRQSALSNEEFNKQTVTSIMERQRQELGQAIPTIQASMNQMTPMVKMIVAQYGDFVSKAIEAAPQVAEAIFNPNRNPEDNPVTTIVQKQSTTNQATISDAWKQFGDFFRSLNNPVPIVSAYRETSQQHTDLEEHIHTPTLQEGLKISDTLSTTLVKDTSKPQAITSLSQGSQAKIITTDNVKTIIFKHATFGPSGSQSQSGVRAVYRFDLNGHIRKLKSIKKLPPYFLSIGKKGKAKTMTNLYINYLQAIHKAWPKANLT